MNVWFDGYLPKSRPAEIHPERSYGLRPNAVASMVIGVARKRPFIGVLS